MGLMDSRPEIFISLDIETDGPAPGVNSMLALGAVAFDETGEQVGGYWYTTFDPLEDATPDDDTMRWWETQPEAHAEVLAKTQDPARAIPEFADWCEITSADHDARLTAVAWPAAFDFAFVNYYCHRFAGRNPLGFSCVD